MIPILFRVGPITVYSYGLMIALGFLAADIILRREFVRHGYGVELASRLLLVSLVSGLVGSRLYDILENLPTYLADPKLMIFSGSGFVFFGGLIGGILASVVFAGYYGIPWLRLADMAAPALLLGHAIGREGCQLSGDGDWGLPSTLPWAMAYPNAIVGWNSQTVLTLDSSGQLVSGYFPGVRVHPTPVYETILYFLGFVVLWSMRKRLSDKDGQVFYLYLILAGASRFVVEFVRINPRVLLGLSEAQLIAIAMVVVGLVGYTLSYMTSAKNPLPQKAGLTQP
jgi:phosphatidylglycerol:prolipoprotein diacylglycerol transferase